uniref:Uncharacterized protein n=1 Tax=Coccidioides posadasii RMSCC 3488 TaxID=454284 RepID=A0A0J6IHF6_COCPO|nr:hypothetical protein CPAG_07564 [Coccidioides posadasii RMSCC 3488]
MPAFCSFDFECHVYNWRDNLAETSGVSLSHYQMTRELDFVVRKCLPCSYRSSSSYYNRELIALTPSSLLKSPTRPTPTTMQNGSHRSKGTLARCAGTCFRQH